MNVMVRIIGNSEVDGEHCITTFHYIYQVSCFHFHPVLLLMYIYIPALSTPVGKYIWKKKKDKFSPCWSEIYRVKQFVTRLMSWCCWFVYFLNAFCVKKFGK